MAAVVPIGYPQPVYDYGPPYTPQVAAPGLIPTIPVDVPICIILIIFFVAAAGVNLAVLVRNLGRGHKFLFSSVLVGFCVTRIIALSLRIAWATQPWNVRLNIAGSIFASAGVVLLYIVNLIFAHRLLCGLHPNLGWLPAVCYFFYFCYFLLIVCLICAITAFTASFYTLVPDDLHDCHLVQLFASTTFAILAFLPIAIVLFAAFYPGLRCPEPFGYGSLTTKIVLVLAAATLLTIGAVYSCAASYAVRPIWFPGWWHHKACYYVFLYVLELVVIFLYALLRFDLRFHIPDGACKAGDYHKGQHAYKRVSGLTFRASFDERVTVHVDARKRHGSSRTEYFTPSGNLDRHHHHHHHHHRHHLPPPPRPQTRGSYLPRTDYFSRASYLSGIGSGTRSSRSSRSEEICNEINGGRDVRVTRQVIRERVYEKNSRGRPSHRRSSKEKKRSRERRRHHK